MILRLENVKSQEPLVATPERRAQHPLSHIDLVLQVTGGVDVLSAFTKAVLQQRVRLRHRYPQNTSLNNCSIIRGG
jgi:hypothetical protein